MAVNDFWRRLGGGDLTSAEFDAKLYINPLLFEATALDLLSGSGITLAQARVSLNLPTGTSAGDELTDVVTSINSIPGTGLAKRAVQRQVVQNLVAVAILCARGARIPSNPYPDGNSVRLRYKALVTLEGGTPAGTVNAP